MGVTEREERPATPSGCGTPWRSSRDAWRQWGERARVGAKAGERRRRPAGARPIANETTDDGMAIVTSPSRTATDWSSRAPISLGREGTTLTRRPQSERDRLACG